MKFGEYARMIEFTQATIATQIERAIANQIERAIPNQAAIDLGIPKEATVR